MNLGDIHRVSSHLLTPVKLGRSLDTVTRAVIHQPLDGNQINKLSENYKKKKCIEVKKFLDIIPKFTSEDTGVMDEGQTHHIGASKEMIGVCWQEF